MDGHPSLEGKNVGMSGGKTTKIFGSVLDSRPSAQTVYQRVCPGGF
jgi:hypothetical protein